jgi:hypothetical protein
MDSTTPGGGSIPEQAQQVRAAVSALLDKVASATSVTDMATAVEKAAAALKVAAEMEDKTSESSRYRLLLITNQAILHRGGLAASEEPGADFKQLVVADDDDDPSPDSAAPAEPDRVDFNKLCPVLDGLRHKEPLDASRLAAGAVSGLLVLAGMILLLLAWRVGKCGRLVA